MRPTRRIQGRDPREWVRHKQDPINHTQTAGVLRWYEYPNCGVNMQSAGLKPMANFPILTVVIVVGPKDGLKGSLKGQYDNPKCFGILLSRPMQSCVADALRALWPLRQSERNGALRSGWCKGKAQATAVASHPETFNPRISRHDDFISGSSKGPASKYLLGYVDCFYSPGSQGYPTGPKPSCKSKGLSDGMRASLFARFSCLRHAGKLPPSLASLMFNPWHDPGRIFHHIGWAISRNVAHYAAFANA